MESLFKLKTIIDYYITFLLIWWLKRKICPPVAKKTISKPGGGTVKALQRHLWESATCVFRQNRDFT
jgi:hypothetical protein